MVMAFAGCSQSTSDHPVDRAAGRDAIRAYYGAPPVIPHAVRELGRSDCLACHDDGLQRTNGEPAVPKPHATLGDCRQCHVEQHRDVPLVAANSFVGLREPRDHHAAYAGAPPTIPHGTWLRESCLACHGPRGHRELWTTHPERTNCTQCHVTRDPDAAAFVGNSFVSKGATLP